MKVFAFVVGLFPLFVHASPFDRHFGSYSVVSITNEIQTTCPLLNATISRKPFGGYLSIVLEASGTNDCEAFFKSVISVQGMPGANCIETADDVQCVHERGRFHVSVRPSEENLITIKFIDNDSDVTASSWVLRKK